MNSLFPGQKVLNFLPATVVLAGANGPDKALNRSGNLPCPAWSLLGRRIAIEKGGYPFNSNGLQPESYRFSMAIQLAGNRGNGEPLSR